MTQTVALAVALADAARMVARVASGRSLSDELERAARSETPRGALIDLTHGTLRQYGRVQALVRVLSRRERGDELVEALLWCALYAVDSGRYSDYVAVDQAVGACGLLERWNAKGYVNAVLRSYLRERDALRERVSSQPEARHQHPGWWIDIVRAAYQDRWESVLASGNDHPPMALRVNRRRGEVEPYRSRLEASGIPSTSLGAQALLLERGVPVERLPGFNDGEVSVQDAGAQCAAAYLDLAAGQRVLDACAAPGGKAGHVLESEDVQLTALDPDPKRVERLKHNLDRLGVQARVVVADCTRPADWWDGNPFDRILADVPCTASGIARRHPDVKWLRRERDIATFASRQAAMLDALWPTLAADGKLLYVTCSVFPAENEDVIGAFVARTAGAQRMALPDGAPAQRLPGPGQDGFFYALIAKRA